jgi:proline iminopeptidase
MSEHEVDFVDVDGARLQVRTTGQGDPVLVVGSSVYYPRIFSSHLRDHLRLSFLDLRHFSESDGSVPVQQISIDTYANDIEHARRTLELGDVIVLGHSLHGCIALEYARRYRLHTRGVVVMGSYPFISDHEPDAAQRLWDAEASDERKDLLDRNLAALSPEVRASLSPTELFAREYVADGPKNWFDAAYDSTWLWEGVRVNLPVFERMGTFFETYDLGQDPGTVDVPVLIAQGRYDYNAAYTLWEEHRHKLARHRFALFGRSGHFPSLEEPETFDKTLVEWIRGLD